jgi:hypothetical protein
MPISANGTHLTFNDSTTQTTAAAALYASMNVFTSPGTFNIPPTTTRIKVTVVGGGGGTPGSSGAPMPQGEGWAATAPGGSGGAGGAGGTGGTTSFGSYATATGGTGGGFGTSPDLHLYQMQWILENLVRQCRKVLA